ncbi:MAG: hypothetical protein A3B68_09115 [Candidatus Melainabacteria bacterium RIFCSPHIGHO2_02_FULL_34_12]|nr:MAG: hypothetical protein A3B68_09115 [Candidatus Melainabacteria bacterium RIFCSPHIGHO2_02_FULL_34_12]
MLLKKIVTYFFLSVLVIFLHSCASHKKAFNFVDKDKLRIALVLAGPVNDSSWNAAAYNGLKRFQTDYKVEIAVVEKVNLESAKTVFCTLADKKYNLIIAHSYDYGAILEKVVPSYPDIFFGVIGGEVKQEPNLCSFSFKDEQYGYLIGAVAGLNTATNKVGIVVGKKTPIIEKTIIGLRKGLKSVNPKADLVVSYINVWDDISKGREAAIEQINTGVDVITHLADSGGVGVIKAAEDADISAIGAITDQHDLAPTAVITSGIEDASQLVYLICENYVARILEPLIYRFGLKDQIVDITESYGNIDPTTEARINRIKAHLTELEIAQMQQSRGKKKNKK